MSLRRHPHPALSVFYVPSRPRCHRCLQCKKSSAECDPSLFPEGRRDVKVKKDKKNKGKIIQNSSIRLCKFNLCFPSSLSVKIAFRNWMSSINE